MTKKPPLSDDDKALWDTAVKSVKALKHTQKGAPIPPKKALPAALPARAAMTPAAPRRTPARLAAPEPVSSLDQSTSRKLSSGKINIEAIIDLHGMTQAEAQSALHRFVLSSVRKNHRSLLIITGKGGRVGGGVLREKLPLWLEAPDLRPHIIGISTAHIRHGGTGAFYVRLKK